MTPLRQRVRTTAQEQQPVERTNPFAGARAFRREERQNFFGRRQELADLVALVSAKQLLILHAPSGAGKSSLVNASLLHRLGAHTDGRHPHPPGTFDVLGVANVHPGAVRKQSGWPSSDEVPNVYVTAALDSIGQGARSRYTTLGGYLASREKKYDEFGAELPKLIVFDQFEEILEPYGRDDWLECRDALFVELETVLRHDPLLHVMLVIREDHLATMERLTEPVPARLRVRYRLDKLTREQARTAIREPAERSGLPIDDEALDTLLQELSQQRLGGIDNVIPSEFVEPAQLSVVCRQLWDQADAEAADVDTPPQPGIRVDHLRELGGVAGTLQKYYDNAVTTESRRSVARRLRQFFEVQLISDRGTRQLVPFDEAADATRGVPNAVLDRLEEPWGLVRQERRGDTTYLELSHDGFIQPIRRANFEARERQRRSRMKWSAGLTVAVIAVAAFVVYALTLPSTAPLDGTVGTPLDFDLPGFQSQRVKFTGEPGQIVTLEARALEADEATLLTLDIYDDDNDLLGTGTFTRSDSLMRAVSLPPTGALAAVVDNPADTPVHVELSTEPLDVVRTQQIRLGERIEGTVEKGDVVRLQFRADSGTILAVNVTSSTEAAETFVQLLDPDGNMPPMSDPTAERASGIPRVVLQRSGQYTILVSGSGPYALTVAELDAHDLDDGPLDAEIAPGEVQNAILAGRQGQVVGIALRPRDPSVRVNLELRDATDTVIATDSAGPGAELRLVSVLPASGPYHVVVWGISAGDYTLQVEAPEVTDVSLSERVISGDATGPQVYSIATDVGDVIQFRLQSVTEAADVHIIASDGTALGRIFAWPAHTDAVDSMVVVGTAREPTLLLVDGSGPYEVSITRQEVIEIADDITVTGEIAAPGDVVAYRHSASAGERLSLRTTTSPDSGLDTMLEVWSPDGSLLEENDDSADSTDAIIPSVEITTSGDQLIVVSGWDTTVGDYELSVTTD